MIEAPHRRSLARLWLLAGACLLIACLLIGGEAWGQANVRGLSPHPMGSPTLSLAGTTPLGRGGLSASLWSTAESRPLIFYKGGARTADIITARSTLDLAFAAGLSEGVDLGLVTPMVLSQTGRQVGDPGPIARFAFGDPRLTLKGQIFDKRSFNLGLSLVLTGTVPLGDADALVGERNATGEALLAFEIPIGHRLDLLVNGGARLREDTDIGGIELSNELLGGLGVSWRAWPGLAFSGEVVGRTALSAPFEAVEASPVAANAAVRWQLWHGLTLVVGGGAGLQAGYGAPAWRGLIGVEAAPRRDDYDGDLLADGDDRCVTEPGDLDREGCPAPPPPPTVAQVIPAEDPDGDGITGADDECPFIAEDFDQFLDLDGCPDPDNDFDGVADADDGAPLAPEDLDGYADQDGVPDPDNDGDGVLDVVDQCPLEAGPDGGCPQGPAAPLDDAAPMLLGDTLHPGRPMRFEFARSPLHAESAPLIAALADFLKARPDWGPVEVGVHTDALGSQSWKWSLSVHRAAEVRAALIAAGVPEGRLTAKGYGPSIPVASNETREGRYRNRRVELRFLRPPPKAAIKAPTPSPEVDSEAPANEAPSDEASDAEDPVAVEGGK